MKSNIKTKVNEVINLTGLDQEKNKKIQALSKGYRQRVGLAQAMIHDPEVLILDEPTSGLDPNQIMEIRNVIKKVGEEKTVLLSTHIMQEVEAMCDRVIIINKGNLVLNKTLKELQKDHSKEKLVVHFQNSVSLDALKSVLQKEKIEKITGREFSIQSDVISETSQALFKFAVENKNVIIEQKVESQSLEHIFRKLTHG